jgi:hypothetical protein
MQAKICFTEGGYYFAARQQPSHCRNAYASFASGVVLSRTN